MFSLSLALALALIFFFFVFVIFFSSSVCKRMCVLRWYFLVYRNIITGRLSKQNKVKVENQCSARRYWWPFVFTPALVAVENVRDRLHGILLIVINRLFVFIEPELDVIIIHCRFDERLIFFGGGSGDCWEDRWMVLEHDRRRNGSWEGSMIVARIL